MGNKSLSPSKEESTKKPIVAEVNNNAIIKPTVISSKNQAVRRNSATTVASSTTSASTTRTNSPPALLQSSDLAAAPRTSLTSQKRRPRGVADMEIKSHCEKIKRIVGTSRLSKIEEHAVLSSSDESVVYECFGTIVTIAQNSAPLETNTLDDFLITCNAIRKNQPKLAGKVELLMSEAKKIMENLVVSVGSDTQTTYVIQSSSSSSSVPSSQQRSGKSSSQNDHVDGDKGSDGVVLSQHATINTPSNIMQEMLHQYDLARAAGATASTSSADGENTITRPSPVVPSILVNGKPLHDTLPPVPAPVSVARSAPPPIQVTTVRSGPPPIQVTTVKPGPPPIQITTVNQRQ